MITPTKITDFNRSDRDLQLFWLFCIVVAGKNSDFAASKIAGLFKNLTPDETPFAYLKANQHAIHNLLVANKVGQYGRIERAFSQSLDLNLRTATLEQLLEVFGVGSKTARFFLLHSRQDCSHVVLDTHVLAYLRDRWKMDVPAATPPAKEYERIEAIAANLIRADYPGLSMAEADLLIWTKQSGRLE